MVQDSSPLFHFVRKCISFSCLSFRKEKGQMEREEVGKREGALHIERARSECRGVKEKRKAYRFANVLAEENSS